MLSTGSIIDRIRSLDSREWAQDALDEFARVISECEELEMIKQITDIPLIKKFIDRYVDKLKDIDKELLEKRDLSILERENLLDRKALYNEFIKEMDWETRLKDISSSIDEQLSDEPTENYESD